MAARLQVRLPEDHYDFLQETGWECRLYGGTVIVEPQEVGDKTYLIPDPLTTHPDRPLLYVVGYEFNDGNEAGTVVCSLSGEPLRPLEVFTDRYVRAVFAARKGLYNIEATKHGLVTITRYVATPQDHEHVLLEESVVFEGDPDELPLKLAYLDNAITAAFRRLHSPDNLELCYYK